MNLAYSPSTGQYVGAGLNPDVREHEWELVVVAR